MSEKINKKALRTERAIVKEHKEKAIEKQKSRERYLRTFSFMEYSDAIPVVSVKYVQPHTGFPVNPQTGELIHE